MGTTHTAVNLASALARREASSAREMGVVRSFQLLVRTRVDHGVCPGHYKHGDDVGQGEVSNALANNMG